MATTKTIEVEENVTLTPFVGQLASVIYSQLDALIKTYGVGSFSSLMQSMVEVLEQLEKFYRLSISINEDYQKISINHEVALVNLEKEKLLRIRVEERLFEYSDLFDREKRVLENKIKLSFDEIKELNYKLKIINDQNDNLEKVLSNKKSAYQDLHDRYRDILLAFNRNGNEINSVTEAENLCQIKKFIVSVDKSTETINFDNDLPFSNNNHTQATSCSFKYSVDNYQNDSDQVRKLIDSSNVFYMDSISQSLANELASITKNNDQKISEDAIFIDKKVEDYSNDNYNTIDCPILLKDPEVYQSSVYVENLKPKIVQIEPLNNDSNKKPIIPTVKSSLEETHKMPLISNENSSPVLMNLSGLSDKILPTTSVTAIDIDSSIILGTKFPIKKVRTLPNPFGECSNSSFPNLLTSSSLSHTTSTIENSFDEINKICMEIPDKSTINKLNNHGIKNNQSTKSSTEKPDYEQLIASSQSKIDLIVSKNEDDFYEYFSKKAQLQPNDLSAILTQQNILLNNNNDSLNNNMKNAKTIIPPSILKYIQDSKGKDIDLCKQLQNLLFTMEDLIMTRDQVNEENAVLKSKIDSLNCELLVAQDKFRRTDEEFYVFRHKLLEVEHDMRRLKQENETLKSSHDKRSVNEPIPRTEMQRIIQERNNYKKRLEDLQEAVQLAEMIRISKDNQANKKKSFLSRLFGGLLKPKTGTDLETLSSNKTGTTLAMATTLTTVHSSMQHEQKSWQNNLKIRQYDQAIIHDESKDHKIIFGWFISSSTFVSTSSLPMPIFFRLLSQDTTNLKKATSTKLHIWCGDIYNPFYKLQPAINSYPTYMNNNNSDGRCLELKSWIGFSKFISIFDPSLPDSPVEWIDINSGFILCICSVPGMVSSKKFQPTISKDEISNFASKHTLSVLSSNENENWESLRDKPETVYPTMWVGCESGRLVIFSSYFSSFCFLGSVKLSDSIIGICHYSDMVVIVQTTGILVRFSRNNAGRWDLINRKTLDLGRPNNCVRSAAMVNESGKLLVSHRNRIHVIDVCSFRIMNSFDVSEDPLQQIRSIQLSPDGRLAFVTLRLDCSIFVYDTQTCKLVTFYDLEPYIYEAFGANKMDFSSLNDSKQKLVRITAVLSTAYYLWIGTSLGNILSFSVTSPTQAKYDRPYLPLINQAQFSFHGHVDSVKFFLEFNPQQKTRNLLQDNNIQSANLDCNLELQSTKNSTQTLTHSIVISGGDGYMDFRIGKDNVSSSDQSIQSETNAVDTSYLIVWQLGGTVK